MSDDQHDDSVYDGLLGGDSSQWAFGTSFEDPLAGVDTTLPDGFGSADGATLAAYCLMLGDDALVYSHRLSQWASNAPDLEEDIALANIALDLLGQARLLLARAAAADPDVVPTLGDSPAPPEDRLAFFRDSTAFRNVRLVEADNGDFAVTTVRLLLLATWRLALMQRLVGSRDAVLAAVAAKAVKELAYHRDHAARWVVTLARGTEESRRRTVAALDVVWPLRWELDRTHEVEARAAVLGVGVDPADVAGEVDVLLEQVLSVAGLERPDVKRVGPVGSGTGRDGRHTEAFGRLLAEMQSVARAHPLGQW